MLNKLIALFFNRDESLKTLGLPRSKDWRKFREEWLFNNPYCAVCGSRENVVPHHIVPFHSDPSKELDPSNIISLCENKSFNCHLFFGHLKNYTKSNPFIIQDAAYWRTRLKFLDY